MKICYNFKNLFLALFASLVIIPPYFAFRIPGGIALSAHRILLIGCIVQIFRDRSKLTKFLYLIRTASITYWFLLYAVVAFVNATYNRSPNTFIGPIIDNVILFFIAYYAFYYEIEFHDIVEEFLRYMPIVLFFCIIQVATKFNVFTLFDTIKEIDTSNSMRDGIVRCSGPYAHPLVLSLIFILLLPLMCYDKKRNSIYIFQHPILLVLSIIVLFLSGTRSGIAIYIVEVFVLLIISFPERKGKIVLISFTFIIACVITMFAFKDTPWVQYILRYIFYIVDEVLGTSYALRFGGDISIQNSSNAREYIWMLLQSDSIQKWIGQGTSRILEFQVGIKKIVSIDNFYVLQYIQYGYPGMIIYLIIFVKTAIECLKKSSKITIAMMVAFIGYFANLTVVAQFNSLSYFFIMAAIIFANVKKQKNIRSVEDVGEEKD